jgi:type III pantothenate kinase
MMFLAADIGNSFTTFGLFKKDERFEMTFHFPTASILEREHIEDELLPKFAALGDLSSIVIASVVPDASRALIKTFERTHKEAKISLLKNTDVPIQNTYRDPSQTGTDRLLCSLAAYHKWGKTAKKPVIVIDLGTATTIDCVSAHGEYLGGIIALGMKSGADRLSSIGAQLPEIELRFPEHVLGRSTTESMQSGIMFGAVAMIEGLIARLRKEVFQDKEIFVVATGGLSSLFEGKTPIIDLIAPHLVLEGIAISFFHKQ